MPSNLPSPTLAEYVARVQTDLYANLLSKAEAANLYTTVEAAEGITDDVKTNADELALTDTTARMTSALTSTIAPAGQRDKWQPGSGAIGGQLTYAPHLNIIWSTTSANGMYYSTNGGATFTSCVFDIAPTNWMTVTFNEDVVVALVYSTTQAYTSTDGINFTKRAALPTATLESFNMTWFEAAGLFIAGVAVDSSHRIMTSPDGLTWTVQSVPYESITFATNGTVCVAFSTVSPYATYSYDGITWYGATGISGTCYAICWSAERSEFLAIRNSNGHGFRSADGVTWTTLGGIAPTGVRGLIWVGDYGYNRYYLTAPDSDGNYSLWSTMFADSEWPFMGTHLDGATNSSSQASVVYMAALDTFAIGLGASPWVVYSTVRYDLKAINDNIRVRNAPVATCQLSAYTEPTANNTTTETVLSTTASTIGSLVLQDSQPLGMVIAFNMTLSVSSVGGDTLTMRIKTQAGTMSSVAIVVPALASGLLINICSTMTVQASTLRQNTTTTVNGSAPVLTTGAPAYTRTIANTFSVTGQWSANASSCSMNQLIVESKFINGA
jgi:hypothetical protein